MKLGYRCGVLMMVASVLSASTGLAQTKAPATAAAPTPSASAATNPPAAARVSAPPTAASVSAPPTAAATEATPPTAAVTDPAPSSALLSFPAAPAADESCFPGCRKGFMCHAGACISNCNPPCDAGERCTELNECVQKTETHFADVALPAIDPGAEAHEGFYFRGTLGVGGGGAQRETGLGTAKYTGAASFFSVDFGGSPMENLVIFGRLSSFGLVEPKVKLDNTTLSSSRDDNIDFSKIAVGMSYYFMPINLYIGGAIGPAMAMLGNNDDDHSKTGFGIDLEAGKEWWVTEDWGMGVALRLSVANVPPGNSWSAPSKHLGAAALGVLFTATYN